MLANYKQKIIRTLVYLVLITGFSLTAFNIVQARYIQNRVTLQVDGIIVDLTPDSMTINTAGASNIAVLIDFRRTIFARGLTLADFSLDDRVSIIARSRDSDLVAQMIRKLPGTGYGTGYGTAGANVQVLLATVTGKTGNTFTVFTGTNLVTFQVLSSTRFFRTSFAALAPGDSVTVHGQDNGSQFVARQVTKR